MIKGFKIFLIMLSVLTILTVGSILLIQHYNRADAEVPADKVEHTCEFNGDWVVEKEPTCYSEGLKYQLCECGERQEETISMTEHNMSEWAIEKESTYTEEGLKTCYCQNEGCFFTDYEYIPVLTIFIEDNILIIPSVDSNANIIYYRDLATEEQFSYEFAGDVTSFDLTILLTRDYQPMEYGKTYQIQVMHDISPDPDHYHAVFSNLVEYSTPVLEQEVSDFVFTPINAEYAITTEGAEDHIGYMLGDGTRNDCNGYLGTETDIVIPGVHNGKPVLMIGANSFQNSSVVSVKLSEGIVGICDYAFYKCANLSVIELPASFEWVNGLGIYRCTNIDKYIVNADNGIYSTLDDGNLLVNKNGTEIYRFAPYGITNYVIPEGIVSIASDAFQSSSNLLSVELPLSLQFIHDYAFSYCSGLTEITLPGNVNFVATSAFRSCNNLTKLTILYRGSVIEYFNLPSSITEIEVNNALFESYKIADGWSDYADMIKEHSYFNGTFELTFEYEGISETHLLESNVNTPSTEEEWPIKLDGVNCGGGFDNSCQLRVLCEELHFDLSYDEVNKQYIGYLWADAELTQLISEVQITKIS